MEPFVGIEENRLVIRNTDEEYIIKFKDDLDIFVNDGKITRSIIVTKKDKIIIQNENKEAKRAIDIKISDDRLKAYIDINYCGEVYSEIELKVVGNTISIIKKDMSEKMPPAYKKEEIISALKSSGVIYGINKEVLNSLKEYEKIENLLIAEGVQAVDDENDEIIVHFENVKRTVDEQSNEKIDYREFYTNANAIVGQLLGELIRGKVGKDGIDVFLKPVKRKMKQNLRFKATEGCRSENDKIISTVEGRPTVKDGVFAVNKIIEVTSNVDIKSGNINFPGDVDINGTIKDGMVVKAGNFVRVSGNLESASIIAQGEVNVKGNILNSKILAGSRDVEKQEYLELLVKYKEDFEAIISAITQLKAYGNVSNEKTDGELIKILIDTKYKKIPRVSMIMLTNNKILGSNNAGLDQFIRTKLLGACVLSIKHTNELYDLIKYLDEEIHILVGQINIPVDVYVNYCQDSKIKASGSIIVTGKGQYISELTANDNIEFIGDNAVCRGGTLIAGKSINARIIGSTAGVVTKLKVPRDGVITADVVYNNSIFIFGERQYIIEVPSKNVKAYLGEDGDVVAEKFKL